MPLYQHRHLSSRTQHLLHSTDHRNSEWPEAWPFAIRSTRGMTPHSSVSSRACNQLTRDAHATWEPASSLCMAGLPLDWHRIRRNINANPNDILKFFDSQPWRISNKKIKEPNQLGSIDSIQAEQENLIKLSLTVSYTHLRAHET